MTLQQCSAHALQRAADRPAIEYDQQCYRWGDMRRVADAIAAALDASDIDPDAPIAFVPRNRPAALAALLALIAQGRVIRMIYAFQSPAGIARDIARLEPSVLVAFEEDMTADVRAVLERQGIAAIALHGMDAAPVVGFATARGDARARQAGGVPRIEILTSGTTGPPKQFPVSYTLLEAHFLASPLTRHQGDDPQSAPPFLLYFPIGNITGLYSTLPMLIRGQRIMLLERFTLDNWLDHVRRYRPAHSGLPAACIGQLLDADVPKDDLASLKAIGTGAAPLDPGVQRAFEDRYGIPVLLSYGATEFAGPVASMTADLHVRWGRSKIGSVGRAMPGAQLRVVDMDTGEPVLPGVSGLLDVVSPRIGPDWIRTSDIGLIDSDGFLFLHGRADGAINRGGFKLLPESIERALMLYPDIVEAAVVGVPDDRLGQVPAAAIRLRAGVSPPALHLVKAHLRNQVMATHIPVKWLFVSDLPRTPSLKTDRIALTRLLMESGREVAKEAANPQ